MAEKTENRKRGGWRRWWASRRAAKRRPVSAADGPIFTLKRGFYLRQMGWAGWRCLWGLRRQSFQFVRAEDDDSGESPPESSS